MDTFFKHYLDLKLCILYLFLKLGKSGVQCFKRYMIWRWNEEVMAVWRQTRKAEREFRSRDAIWKGVSQLRNHFLAHECHLQHSSPHFEAAIHLWNHLWAAKSLLSYEMGCENSPPLRNPPPAAKMLQASKMVCEHATFLRNDLQASKWLRNHLQA